MHLEVKVALNFIVSYLYNKLPRRRADLFGEELEQILMSRFEGHWYPESPLRGSAFRCLHLGSLKDPVVELAAKRSGLDTEEVRANVPAELSIWIDPYEVSYQIGEKGAVKVLYFEDPPGLASELDRPEAGSGFSNGDLEAEEVKSFGFNPDAQVFIPIAGQVSPVLLQSLSSSPTPLATSSCQGLLGYSMSSSPTDPSSNPSNTSTPSPPSASLPFLSSQPQPLSPVPPGPRPPLQPITFTTATFAATKFGSTKMKKCSGLGSASVTSISLPPRRSPTAMSPSGLLKHKSLSLHSLGGPAPSQLSPNAKEFIYPAPQVHPYLDADVPALFPSAHPHPRAHATFDPFSSPPPGPAVGMIGGGGGAVAFVEKSPFVEGLGGYNLQYPSPAFQPVVLAN
ncbi:protein Tob2-like [Denticeps clupeoides]|uniref:Anti-proliferative protein domain-containing protein n=1 Tax=Denticeps clupeoides TaxID=299321 RepID=A0AAY4BM60_9TELE|nr:protein Tob2-like [Denticeps clupeoides]